LTKSVRTRGKKVLTKNRFALGKKGTSMPEHDDLAERVTRVIAIGIPQP